MTNGQNSGQGISRKEGTPLQSGESTASRRPLQSRSGINIPPWTPFPEGKERVPRSKFFSWLNSLSNESNALLYLTMSLGTQRTYSYVDLAQRLQNIQGLSKDTDVENPGWAIDQNVIKGRAENLEEKGIIRKAGSARSTAGRTIDLISTTDNLDDAIMIKTMAGVLLYHSLEIASISLAHYLGLHYDIKNGTIATKRRFMVLDAIAKLGENFLREANTGDVFLMQSGIEKASGLTIKQIHEHVLPPLVDAGILRFKPTDQKRYGLAAGIDPNIHVGYPPAFKEGTVLPKRIIEILQEHARLFPDMRYMTVEEICNKLYPGNPQSWHINHTSAALAFLTESHDDKPAYSEKYEGDLIISYEELLRVYELTHDIKGLMEMDSQVALKGIYAPDDILEKDGENKPQARKNARFLMSKAKNIAPHLQARG